MLVFAEKKQDVDDIHEYLLLKGVEAAAIHGGKGKYRSAFQGIIQNVKSTWDKAVKYFNDHS